MGRESSTAMAFYGDEEEVWKCPQHPSKRRRSGICPTCLRDRLNTLCPDCATLRPCDCSTTAAMTSSSISSSGSAGIGPIGLVSNLIDTEPSFRRSRSAAIPFFRPRFAGVSNKPPAPRNRGNSSIWSVFTTHKNKREDEEAKRKEVETENDYAQRMMTMMRSRSVSVLITSDSGAGDFRNSPAKGKGWYFPSPIKVFRQSKSSKVVQERSPLLYRS
ncbi:uncharacterized protein LOC114276866 [Camellia sinensis]|nr:uncharacterized protein LOC114276866 [Camellia sinensis]